MTETLQNLFSEYTTTFLENITEPSNKANDVVFLISWSVKVGRDEKELASL